MRDGDNLASFKQFQQGLLVDTMRRLGWTQKKIDEKLRSGTLPSSSQIAAERKPKLLTLDEVETRGYTEILKALTVTAVMTSVYPQTAVMNFESSFMTWAAYPPREDPVARVKRLAAEVGMELVSKEDAALRTMRMEADALRLEREDTTKPVVIHIKNKRAFQ